MGIIPNYYAHLIEAGSSLKRGESADPRMIRYRTSHYPSDVGIETVIADLEELRGIIRNQEPRLAGLMEEIIINSFDLGLSSKESEGGKTVRDLHQDSTQPRKDLPPPQPLDDMNYSESKHFDQNRNY